MVLLAVLAAAGITAGWYFAPDIAQPLLRPYLPEIVVENLPTRQQPEAPLSSMSVPIAIEATVPADADDAAIRQALVQSYEQAVKQQYGANATINPNVPVAINGAPELVSETNGSKIYRATMSGWVQAGR